MEAMDGGPDRSALHTNPRRFARVAGVFYLLVFVFGIAALRTSGDTRFTANLLVAAVYYVVTVMLYHLYKPVSRAGSLVTALISFAALTIGGSAISVSCGSLSTRSCCSARTASAWAGSL
jgi:hypothetical protein